MFSASPCRPHVSIFTWVIMFSVSSVAEKIIDSLWKRWDFRRWANCLSPVWPEPIFFQMYVNICPWSYTQGMSECNDPGCGCYSLPGAAPARPGPTACAHIVAGCIHPVPAKKNQRSFFTTATMEWKCFMRVAAVGPGLERARQCRAWYLWCTGLGLVTCPTLDKPGRNSLYIDINLYMNLEYLFVNVWLKK